MRFNIIKLPIFRNNLRSSIIAKNTNKRNYTQSMEPKNNNNNNNQNNNNDDAELFIFAMFWCGWYLFHKNM